MISEDGFWRSDLPFVTLTFFKELEAQVVINDIASDYLHVTWTHHP